jgi:hypothetical protein
MPVKDAFPQPITAVPGSPFGRCKAVEVRPSQMFALLRGGHRSNLPEDGRVIEWFSDPWTKRVIFIVESATFEAIPEGAQYPIFDFVVTRDEEHGT